jgi:hypothetical protein
MNALFVAWRPAAPHEGWRPVGRLEHDAGLYRFFYTEGARKLGFRPFPQMGDLEQVYESEELFPVFANRLLSKSRPEYEEFLRWGGFDAADRPDPIVILGVTEGIRQTDAIEVFPCPQPDGAGCYFNKFFLHGIRWVPAAALDRIAKLCVGDVLKLMPDPQNDFDPNAVAVRTDSDRTLIGYIPRYLAYDVWELLNSCEVGFMKLFVERVNPSAPLQNRVLCRMHACWPDGFEPCRGDDFEPIPTNVSARCVE